MPFERLYTDAIDIKIKWSNPCLLSEIKDDKACQHYACLYKILGEYNGQFKLFYIGKSVTRSVWKRLNDADHKAKQADIQDQHRHYKLYVSVGVVQSAVTDSELGEIEKLLIYAHGGNSDFSRCINKQNVLNHHVLTNYSIENLGFKRDGMYRGMGIGMYYRK